MTNTNTTQEGQTPTPRTDLILAGLPEHTNSQACFDGRRGYWIQTDCVLIEADDPSTAIQLFRHRIANSGNIACNHNLASSAIRLATLQRELAAQAETIAGLKAYPKDRANWAEGWDDHIRAINPRLMKAEAERDQLKAEVQDLLGRLDAADKRAEAQFKQVSHQLTEARRDGEPWNTGTPEIPEGGMERFWCAVTKVYHRHLCYANKHPMPLNDYSDTVPDCAEPIEGDEDNYAWTGWYEESCEQCETQWQFSGKVVAWFILPKHSAAMHRNAGEGK